MTAELTFWYGFDARSLDGNERLGYWANLPTVKAQRTIEDGRYEPTAYEYIYSLYLVAYDDERLAEQAKTIALEAYVDERIKQR